MEIIILPEAQKHLKYWNKIGDKKIQKRITNLIKSIQENPFTGIGKPEALKHQLTGKWSRRIDSEHRLIYAVLNNKLYIYALKGHY